MIIVLKANTTKEEVKPLMDSLKAKGMQIDISKGTRQTVMGLVGNTASSMWNKSKAMNSLIKSCVSKSHIKEPAVPSILKIRLSRSAIAA